MNRLFFLSLLLMVVIINKPSARAQTQITFYTSMGDFVVEMYDSITPVTSGNFIDLVSDKFYDGVIFHRVIDNFMIQGGDPTGTGSGGPGYSIPDEFDSSLSNVQKTISMANSGPNTGGSQFFINLVNNTYLDFDKAPFTSKHPVFGKVIANFNVVQDIGKVSVNSSDRPLTDVVMDSLRITNAPWTGTSSIDPLSPGIMVYPNPATSSGAILLNVKAAGTVHISLHDQLGRPVRRMQRTLSRGMNHIDLERFFPLARGVYYLMVNDGNSLSRQQWIIAR